MQQYDQFNKELTIDSFEATVQEIPMHQPMHLAFGDIAARPSGVVTVEVSNASGRQVRGLGEGATLPEPVFTDDSGRNIATNATTILKQLPRHDPVPLRTLVESIHTYRFEDNGRYPTARMAVEMALLDSFSRLYEQPLQKVLGITAVAEVPYGKSIGGYYTHDILRQAEAAISHDAKKIKLKVMPDNFDRALNAIKNLGQSHADVELMIDANGGFDPYDSTHLAMIDTLDDQGLIMIEEPVSRVGEIRGIDAVRLMRQRLPHLQTPICLDDCLSDYDSCIQVVNEDLADVVNIKPGRIGSILRSIDIIDYCDNAGRQVMIGGMFEATPGRCVTTMLGAYCLTKGFTIPGDLSLAQERLAGDIDIDDNLKQLNYGPNGGIVVPTGLGWGYSNE